MEYIFFGTLIVTFHRQSVDTFDIERMASSQEPTFPSQESTAKVRKYLQKTPRLPTPIVRDKILPVGEIQQWSSNSTIDSYCSTTNNVAQDVSLDSPPDEVVEEQETSNKKKVKRKRTGSEASVKSVGCMPNLSLRRHSNTSGQWKGVRWKPVLDSKSGDIWSDNVDMRKTDKTDFTKDIIKNEEETGRSQATCSKCLRNIDETRRNTDPLSNRQDQKIKCAAYHRGCLAYNNIKNGSGLSLSSSLPNLKMSDDSSSDEYIEGEE